MSRTLLRQLEQRVAVAGVDVLRNDLQLGPADLAQTTGLNIQPMEALADLSKVIRLAPADPQQFRCLQENLGVLIQYPPEVVSCLEEVAADEVCNVLDGSQVQLLLRGALNVGHVSLRGYYHRSVTESRVYSIGYVIPPK